MRTNRCGGGGQANPKSVWFFKPAAGLTAADKQAYELVQFTADDMTLPIRRSERAGRQTYIQAVGR